MKRNEFLKRLGLGSLLSVVAPSIVAQTFKSEEGEHFFDVEKLERQIEINNSIPHSGNTPDSIIENYRCLSYLEFHNYAKVLEE